MISLVNIWNMLWRAKKFNIQNGCHAWHPMLLPTRRLPDQAIIRLILWGLNSTLVTSCWHIWDEISLCANWQVMPKTDRVTLLQSGTKIFLVNLGRETKWTTSSKKGQISFSSSDSKMLPLRVDQSFSTSGRNSYYNLDPLIQASGISADRDVEILGYLPRAQVDLFSFPQWRDHNEVAYI